MKTLNPAVARVLQRLHYPLDVILTCVRWYVAYPLSLRHLEEMMAERGVSVDHSTVHRWEDASPGSIRPSSKNGSVPSSGCSPGKTSSDACSCALNVSVSCTTHSKPLPIQ